MNGQLRTLPRRSVGGTEQQTRVQGDDALRLGQHRVEIDFLNLREVHQQLTEARQQRLQRFEIDRFLTAHASERLLNLGAFHQSPGQHAIERRAALDFRLSAKTESRKPTNYPSCSDRATAATMSVVETMPMGQN